MYNRTGSIFRARSCKDQSIVLAFRQANHLVCFVMHSVGHRAAHFLESLRYSLNKHSMVMLYGSSGRSSLPRIASVPR